MAKWVTSENATTEEGAYFVVDASVLGLPPGHWPEKLDTDLGNGQPFVISHQTQMGFVYRQGRITLLVEND